ncbi:MAG TPA: addiction module protein [Verrucomicrobiae bacterium]|jgi:putative addiction module component (TIGR02574 family)|nr:addiction module protein [Verrucomicrobiae bacterium]
MTATIEKEFREMTVAERVELIGELWERVALEPAKIPVPESHMQELERRRKLYRTNPARAIPWADAKALILKRHAKRRRAA